jgi:transposase-like protein
MKNITSRAYRGPYRDPDKEEFWRTTLRDFTASGQGVRAYCHRHGLAEHSFYSWRRNLARRESSGRPPAKQPAFVELLARQVAPSDGGVPLELLAGQRRLLIRSGCDAALLTQVLMALES